MMPGSTKLEEPLLAKRRPAPGKPTTSSKLRRACQRLSRCCFPAVLVAALVSLGVAAGVCLEGWHPITALYVVVQIMTTVGYGDVVVASEAMKAFMTVYVLANLIVVAYFWQSLTQRLVDRNAERLCASMRAARQRLLARGGRGKRCSPDGSSDALDALVAASLQFGVLILAGTVFHRLYEHCTCSDGATLLEDCFDDDYETCVKTGGHTMTWISALYLSVITLTTVGFGDHVPHTKLGHAFGCAWMIFGVVATASFLSSVSDYFFQAEADRRTAEEVENTQQLDLGAALRGIAGRVSRAEYRGLKLAKLGLVPQQVLEEIDREFEALSQEQDSSAAAERYAETSLKLS